jgi:hypothetical protein
VIVEIYSMNGLKILSKPVIPGVNHEFNIAGMPAGLYVVKVVADDFVETIKLVRTR